VVGVTDSDPESEGTSADANPGGESLETTVQALEARLDALSKQVSGLRDELHDERDEREELKDELAARDERIDELEAEVARLDARTDILEVVENADKMTGKQRAVTLVQHLHRAAKARERRDEPPAATVDRDEAEEALHYPNIDRTTIYRDMERAARLIDGSALQYENGELRLDLDAGSLPRKYTADQEGENL
jgi:septal ring factor EnvC (AmiA/AmiB activator)